MNYNLNTTDIHVMPYSGNKIPNFLKPENYLSEFKTKVDKARVRANLGISDDLINEWGNIGGLIENLTDLMLYLNNLNLKNTTLTEWIQALSNEINSSSNKIQNYNILQDKIDSIQTSLTQLNYNVLTNTKDISSLVSGGDSTLRIDIEKNKKNIEDINKIISDFEVGVIEETDPVFKASPAYSITSNDISSWNSIENTLLDIQNNYATKVWIQQQNYLTQHLDLSLYVLKSEIQSYTSLDNYYTKSEIDSKGYLTQHLSLSELASNSELLSLKNEVSELKAQLTAARNENTQLKLLHDSFVSRFTTLEADVKALKENSGELPQPVDEISSISVTPSLIQITEGDDIPSVTITGNYTISGTKTLTSSDYTVTSSDSTIATWNNGVVVKNVGAVSLTIQSIIKSDVSAQLAVVIQAKEIEPEPEIDELISLDSSSKTINKKVGDNPVAVVFTAKYQSGRTEPVIDVTCTSTNQSVAKWENNKVTIGIEGSATLTFDYQGVKCAIAVNVNVATSEDPVDYIGWASSELSEVIGNESCKTSLDGDINLTSVPGFIANKVLLIASKEELTISQPGLGVFSFSDNQHGYYNDYYWYAIGPLKTNESIINVIK